MNPLLRKNILVVFSLLLFSSSFCSAQSVAQQETRLADLSKQLQTQQANLKTLQSELSDYPERIANAEKEVQIAEADSRTEKKELERLEGLSSEGQDLSREIKLQTHTVKMGERRIDSETRSLERIRRYQDSLKTDAENAQASVTRLEQQISQQRKSVADAKSVAAKAESEKTVLAVPAPPKVDVAPVVQAPKAAAIEEPKAAAIATAPAVAPKKDESVLSAEDKATLASVREYLATIEAYKAEGKSTELRYDSLNLSGNKMRGRTSFEHIVNNQYRVEVPVNSGEQFISIGRSQFMIDIPKSNDNATYVFYFDASEGSKGRIVFFNKMLLQYL